MYRLRLGRSMTTGARVLVRSSLLALALIAGGCAATQGERTPAARIAGPVPPAPVAELEDDGLPAQVPPSKRAAREPDDPNEPFSPNYGGAASRARQDDTVGTRKSAALLPTQPPAPSPTRLVAQLGETGPN